MGILKGVTHSRMTIEVDALTGLVFSHGEESYTLSLAGHIFGDTLFFSRSICDSIRLDLPQDLFQSDSSIIHIALPFDSSTRPQKREISRPKAQLMNQ